MRPRPYISFSQMTTFEMSKQKFVDRYIYNKMQFISRNMAYGSKLADGLEAEEATGDPFLDLIMAKIPKFEIMDKPVESKKGFKAKLGRDGKEYTIPVIENGKDPIPLMAVPDTAKKDYSAFKEYKTSVRKWTQKMADDSGQITFYATAIWYATGKIPQDIELINAQVEYQDDGSLQPTGDIIRFKTKRSMVDVIKMTGRIKKAWHGIAELCEKELI